MELTVRVPIALAGEVGEPLRSEIVALICALEPFCYWPFDFGEATEMEVELIFIKGSEKAMAKRLGDFFIKKHGDV